MTIERQSSTDEWPPKSLEDVGGRVAPASPIEAPAQRMTLAIALAVSASVSALVVDGLEVARASRVGGWFYCGPGAAPMFRIQAVLCFEHVCSIHAMGVHVQVSGMPGEGSHEV